jgi:hypothetical protein
MLPSRSDVTLGLATAVLSALEAALLAHDRNKEVGLDPELLQAGVLLALRDLARHPAAARERIRRRGEEVVRKIRTNGSDLVDA